MPNKNSSGHITSDRVGYLTKKLNFDPVLKPFIDALSGHVPLLLRFAVDTLKRDKRLASKAWGRFIDSLFKTELLAEIPVGNSSKRLVEYPYEIQSIGTIGFKGFWEWFEAIGGNGNFDWLTEQLILRSTFHICANLVGERDLLTPESYLQMEEELEANILNQNTHWLIMLVSIIQTSLFSIYIADTFFPPSGTTGWD